MTLRDYIRRNRETIDAVAHSSGYRGRLNDDDRRDWIMNEEGLYRDARRSGCRI